MKVLYISASGRSGSTIVGNVLGELDGFFHAGELRTLWGRGLVGGRLCGCGQPVRECPFWSSVLERALSGDPGTRLDAMEVNRLHEQAVRLRYLPRMLRRSPPDDARLASLRRYANAAERLYLAIGSETGARVIVDSSKQPADGAVLRSLPNVEPFILQLVRDPRAVAYSWQRHKRSPGEGSREEMMRLTPSTSARNWMVVNLTAAAVRRRLPASRSLVVRYESFVAHPRETVERILRMLGEESRNLPFTDDDRMQLTPGHTAGGNPDRFRTGPVALREDTEWLDQQPKRDRVISTIISLPLLRRYGYHVFPRRAG